MFYKSKGTFVRPGVHFGELLQHPIIESLKGDPREYIIELLYAFNSGDLARFEALEGQWSTQPDLAHNANALRDKISLLSLMEMTFKSANGENEKMQK